MKKAINIFMSFIFLYNSYAQNVGIGTTTPTEMLEVNGTIKATGLAVTQGNPYDAVKKGMNDQLIFSKGSKGVGINYIIAIGGVFSIE